MGLRGAEDVKGKPQHLVIFHFFYFFYFFMLWVRVCLIYEKSGKPALLSVSASGLGSQVSKGGARKKSCILTLCLNNRVMKRVCILTTFCNSGF